MTIEILTTFYSAVAEAVLSYAIEKFDPSDRMREWLRKEPARMAYQKALARTYTAFSRQYPEIVSSFFDELFLRTKAAPELAKQLTRHKHPDSLQLALLWKENLPNANDQHLALIGRAADDFIKFMEYELKSETIFQPIFDSRALENLSEIEKQLAQLTEEIKKSWDAALNIAIDYQNTIDQHGTVYNYYYGVFTSLHEHYIAPYDIFDRVRVDEFEGRKWLDTRVDRFLADPSRKSGVLVIIGDAGRGKTSFSAHLVKSRGYLHVFADNVGGEEKLPLAIRSLSAQIISRYRIEPYAQQNALPSITAQSCGQAD